MMDEYAKHHQERDRQYRDAWQSPEAREWLARMTPEERGKLESEGLLAPMLPKDGVANGCGIEEDTANSPLASVDAPRVSASDSLDAILADYPHLEQAIEERARKMNGGSNAGDTLRKLALLFIDQGRRALNADCLAFVSGLAVRMGETGTSIAARHGITRQAFHKRCNEIRSEFGLPPSRAQKSDKSKCNYRLSNRRWKRS